MVIGPRIMPDSVVDERVGITGAFATELPYGPILSMFGIKECDEAIKRIAIRTLGIRLRRTRPSDEILSALS